MSIFDCRVLPSSSRWMPEQHGLLCTAIWHLPNRFHNPTMTLHVKYGETLSVWTTRKRTRILQKNLIGALKSTCTLGITRWRDKDEPNLKKQWNLQTWYDLHTLKQTSILLEIPKKSKRFVARALQWELLATICYKPCDNIVHSNSIENCA